MPLAATYSATKAGSPVSPRPSASSSPPLSHRGLRRLPCLHRHADNLPANSPAGRCAPSRRSSTRDPERVAAAIVGLAPRPRRAVSRRPERPDAALRPGAGAARSSIAGRLGSASWRRRPPPARRPRPGVPRRPPSLRAGTARGPSARGRAGSRSRGRPRPDGSRPGPRCLCTAPPPAGTDFSPFLTNPVSSGTSTAARPPAARRRRPAGRRGPRPRPSASGPGSPASRRASVARRLSELPAVLAPQGRQQPAQVGQRPPARLDPPNLGASRPPARPGRAPSPRLRSRPSCPAPPAEQNVRTVAVVLGGCGSVGTG